MKSDDELMMAHQSGDTSAFTELFARHRPMLRVVAQRRLGCSRHDADDLIQDTMLSVAVSRGYRPEGKFRAWVLQIMRRKRIDSLRKSPRVPVFALDAGDDGIDEGQSPFDAASERETAEMVAAALAECPQPQSETFSLFMGGKSLPEIAAMHCVPLPTAKSRLRMAKDRVRSLVCVR